MLAPVELTHDKSSVVLQWAAPASDGASPITSYVLYAKADFESQYVEVFAGMKLFHNVTNLATGFYYQFKVQALNQIGSSALSPASASILTGLLPGVPTGLTLSIRN
jgi:hypothetical protein